MDKNMEDMTFTCNFLDCKGNHKMTFCDKLKPGIIPENILTQVLDSDGCPRCLRDLKHPGHDSTCKGFYITYRAGKPSTKYTDCKNNDCVVKMKNGREVKLNKRICSCALEKQKDFSLLEGDGKKIFLDRNNDRDPQMKCNFVDCKGFHKMSFCKKLKLGSIPEDILKQILDSEACPRCLRSVNYSRHDETCQGFYTTYRADKEHKICTDCPKKDCVVKLQNGKEVRINKRICHCALQKQKEEENKENDGKHFNDGNSNRKPPTKNNHRQPEDQSTGDNKQQYQKGNEETTQGINKIKFEGGYANALKRGLTKNPRDETRIRKGEHTYNPECVIYRANSPQEKHSIEVNPDLHNKIRRRGKVWNIVCDDERAQSKKDEHESEGILKSKGGGGPIGKTNTSHVGYGFKEFIGRNIRNFSLIYVMVILISLLRFRLPILETVGYLLLISISKLGQLSESMLDMGNAHETTKQNGTRRKSQQNRRKSVKSDETKNFKKNFGTANIMKGGGSKKEKVKVPEERVILKERPARKGTVVADDVNQEGNNKQESGDNLDKKSGEKNHERAINNNDNHGENQETDAKKKNLADENDKLDAEKIENAGDLLKEKEKLVESSELKSEEGEEDKEDEEVVVKEEEDEETKFINARLNELKLALLKVQEEKKLKTGHQTTLSNTEK